MYVCIYVFVYIYTNVLLQSPAFFAVSGDNWSIYKLADSVVFFFEMHKRRHGWSFVTIRINLTYIRRAHGLTDLSSPPPHVSTA